MKQFRFTEEQALIVAKWEIGVRNRVIPLTGILFVMLVIIELVRKNLGANMTFSLYMTSYIAAVGIFLMTVYYIESRVKRVAAALMSRALAVSFENETIAVFENGDTKVFASAFSEIERVDMGQRVVRFKGGTDAACIPRELVPAQLIVALEGRLGKENFKIAKWM